MVKNEKNQLNIAEWIAAIAAIFMLALDIIDRLV
jgi:hypothetical protein